MLDFLWSLLKGFLIGNCVCLLLVYLEFWYKRQEHGKKLNRKKKVLDQMEEETIQK